MGNSIKPGELSSNQIVGSVQKLRDLLRIRWRYVILFGAVGGIFAVGLAFLTKTKYTSKVTFIIEESKSGMGGIASLAGQFGLDLGGGSGGGVFSQDNILVFLKSESLSREVLLTKISTDNDKSLADRYAEVLGLKKKWESNIKIGKIDFSKFENGQLPRKEDSLLQIITKKFFLKKDLTVLRPDRKATFIEVKVVTEDEILSHLLSVRLVNIATRKYVEAKTKVKSLNVQKLQQRADSLYSLLNSKTITAAQKQQSLIDLNPAIRTAPVEAEIGARDKTMILTIFSEVTKNLEISKTLLSQELPAIQIVDSSSYPLEKQKPSKLVYLIVGGFLFGFLSILWQIIRKLIK